MLTERHRFGGTLDDLKAVCDAVEAPVLCKDFILTSYQLWGRAPLRGDLALLLVVALEQNALVGLVERAESIGLTPLVECHTADEIDRAVDAGARLIGINARDLTTLAVDLGTFERLAPLIPAGTVTVAESGVRGPRDVIELARAGAQSWSVRAWSPKQAADGCRRPGRRRRPSGAAPGAVVIAGAAGSIRQFPTSAATSDPTAAGSSGGPGRCPRPARPRVPGRAERSRLQPSSTACCATTADGRPR